MKRPAPTLAIICLLTLSGCGWGGPSYWLGQYQARIDEGSRAIETAQDDVGRAAGYTERARGYAERARYSRVFKLVDIREYDRLFEQALQDHEAAVRLEPENAENFLARGLTYYDRAWAIGQDKFGSPADERYWSLAVNDFTRAIELDGSREQAFDMRGMSREHLREYEGAINDYTKRFSPGLNRGIPKRLAMMESLCIDSLYSRGRAVPKAYSSDLRVRVIEAVVAGASRREAA